MVKRCVEAVPLKTNLDPGTLPVASLGWVGSRPAKVKEEYALEELLGPKLSMKLVDWDGQYVYFLIKPCFLTQRYTSRTPCPLVDWENRVISTLAGQPWECWGEAISDATTGIKAA
jgi:hypothetical protein